MRCLWVEFFKRPHTPGSPWERECPLRARSPQEPQTEVLRPKVPLPVSSPSRRAPRASQGASKRRSLAPFAKSTTLPKGVQRDAPQA